MTTMQQEATRKLSMQQVRCVLKKQFETIFGIKFVPKELTDLGSILENSTPKPITNRI
jgi:lipoate-protein ligase A